MVLVLCTSYYGAEADLSLRWAHTPFVGFVMSWLNYYGFLQVAPKKTSSAMWPSFELIRDFLTVLCICIRAILRRRSNLGFLSSQGQVTLTRLVV